MRHLQDEKHRSVSWRQREGRSSAWFPPKSYILSSPRSLTEADSVYFFSADTFKMWYIFFLTCFCLLVLIFVFSYTLPIRLDLRFLIFGKVQSQAFAELFRNWFKPGNRKVLNSTLQKSVLWCDIGNAESFKPMLLHHFNPVDPTIIES